MRLFIAIPLPDEIKNEAGRLHQVLDKGIFRLTKPEQMHITLAFLGETDASQIANIRNKLSLIKFREFELQTSGSGFFPSGNKIRVIWIGLKVNDEFMRLQQQIREIFGFKEKLMPHITIARAKRPLIGPLALPDVRDHTFAVDYFILYESVPGAGGYTYKEMARYHSARNL